MQAQILMGSTLTTQR